MGIALTGLLQGFVETSTALKKYDDEKERHQAELDIKKQDLDLRRQILKGEQASRTLQDRVHQLTIEETLRKLGREHAGNEFLSGLDRPAPGGMAPTAPTPGATEAYLRQYGQQQAQAPGMAATLPPAPAGMPYGTRAPLMAELSPDTQAPAGTTYERMAPRPVLPAPTSTAPAGPSPVPGPQMQGLWNRIADNIGAADGIRPEVVRLFQTSIMPQETANYDTTAVSPKGAQGIGQLMPATGRAMGVTDPMNPIQNIRGSLKYLQQQYDAHGGDIALTLAAYNAGPGAVAQHGGVPPYKETQAYVKRGVEAYQAPPPDSSQMVAGPGAPTPPSATSPLTRQPTAMPSNPDLDRLNSRIAELDTRERALQAGLAQRPELRTDKVQKALEDVRKARQEAETQRRELIKQETPSNEWGAVLRKNNGNVERALVEYQRLQVEQKEAEGASGTRARLQAEQEQRRTQSLQETWKDDASLFVNTRTAQPTDPTQPTREVEALQRQGDVRKITKKQQERLELVQEALPIIQRLNEYTQLIYGPGGALASLTPEERQKIEVGGKAAFDAFVQANPVLTAAQRYVDSHAEALARAFGGLRGAGTEGDVQRAKAGLAQFQAAFGFNLWPPKLSLTLPDTRGSAIRLMDDYNRTLNAVTGQIVGNREFQHPGLPRYDRPEDTPPTRPSTGPRPEAPETLPPPAVGLNPRLSPAPDTAPAAQRPTPTTSATGVQGDDGTLGAFTPEHITQLTREDFERRFSATARAELTPAQRGMAEARWRSRR